MIRLAWPDLGDEELVATTPGLAKALAYDLVMNGFEIGGGTLRIHSAELQRRVLRVRVIDRGPYVGGREYDLTAATARKLGFSGHGPIQATR